jgi:hypothetical protein
MAPPVAAALLALWTVGAAGAPSVEHSTCADNGCTVHMQAAWTCQCNLNCYSHGDCCPDVTDACFNGTEPVLPAESAPHEAEMSHTHAHNATVPTHAAPKPRVARNSTAPAPVVRVPPVPTAPATAKGSGREEPTADPAGGHADATVPARGAAPTEVVLPGSHDAHGSHEHEPEKHEPDKGSHEHEVEKHEADKGAHEHEPDKSSHGKSSSNASDDSKGGSHAGTKPSHHDDDGRETKPSLSLLLAACFLALTVSARLSIRKGGGGGARREGVHTGGGEG